MGGAPGEMGGVVNTLVCFGVKLNCNHSGESILNKAPSRALCRECEFLVFLFVSFTLSR